MAFEAPGWATDELAEEWPENSPSPPSAPVQLPIPQLKYDAASVRAKRGSLRMLGQASARPLPRSRSGSAASYIEDEGQSQPIRIVSGHVDDGRGHIASSEHDGLLSPPSSRSSSGSVATPAIAAAGTCVVKEGVEDNRGQHLARNPMGPKGGKDIFGALPLERMFDPPSPPVVPQEPASDPEPLNSTPVATPTPAVQARRASHPYAPANPSRLSKSVTPSSNESYTTSNSAGPSLVNSAVKQDETEIYEGEQGSLVYYDDPTEQAQHAQPAEPQSTTKSLRLGEMTLKSGEIETDLSPFVNKTSSGYPFTFSAPRQASSGSVQRVDSEERSIFDPELAGPAEGPSHSTLHVRGKSMPSEPTSQPVRGASRQSSNPALRLFRSTYDTYTREHLSALVDSIAIEPSPSPPTSHGARNAHAWSPAEGPISPSASGSRSTPSGSSISSDARSSKRLRLSPPSPPKRVIGQGLRDWGAQGRAMMDRIRGRDAGEESTTSASKSQATASTGRDDYDESPSIDYADIPPTPPLAGSPAAIRQPERGTHRSNPSTTSSGYLRAAEDIMARIKQRKVSESASGVDSSPNGMDGRRVLSESDENRMWDDEAERYTQSKAHTSAKEASPRRMLRRLSASEEIKRVHEGDSGDSDEQLSTPSRYSHRQGLQERRPTRAAGAVMNGAPFAPSPAFATDDLDRFVSSSTHATSHATSTTMSTSFVKHRGPRAAAGTPGSAMRMIRPDDVHGVVPDRIGKMRFDRAAMRWVREGLGAVDEAGESKAGGSEESVDVFAEMESSPDSGERTASKCSARVEISIFSSTTSASTSDNEDLMVAEADQTRIIQDFDSMSETDSEVEGDEPTTMPSNHHITAGIDLNSPHRPAIHHVSSAPAVMTPVSAAHAPKPIRSALRNAATPATAFKKRTGWSDEKTPGPFMRGITPGSSGKRSVSFSDGRKTGKIMGLEVELQTSTLEWAVKDDLFKGDASGASKGGIASARTQRIRGLLEGMEEMSLEDETPSKPSRHTERPPSRASSVHSSDSESTVPIKSFRTGRSIARAHTPRNPGNATFLTECSFGVAHDRLVALITDVQPFEPHWEQLKSINLKGKGADSVARLKEFLPMLDEANLNDNVISYLSGIPSTVRTLHVAGNRLTSLTSVNHLRNIQYLDISRNQLDSVAQLECLKHLRELKADHNAIHDLTGILAMDSLVKLSCAGNKVETIDLSDAKWSRMETLNMSNNKIRSIRDLHKLSTVTSINLDGNQLEHLTPSLPMLSVRVLRFSENDLSHFDLSLFPKLRTLYADSNRLSGISSSGASPAGRRGAARLENLSMRNQRLNTDEALRLSPGDLENVKRLYLSGNSLPDDFFPRTPLYALVYLEAAACRLSSWPRDFARIMPNLKVLNVNYNHLPDLHGVRALAGLRKLTLVGGRLGSDETARSGASSGVLEGLKGLKSLEEVDFRMNPSTLSYYFPLLLPDTALPSAALDPSSTLKSLASVQASKGVTPSTWNAYDARFRKNLPDEWYSKRLVYRGLVMRTCPHLKRLDGVEVLAGERDKAERLLDAAMRCARG
ncbi:hypothetical protein IAU60_002889 [Kwoniella sp. DSM 27419]